MTVQKALPPNDSCPAPGAALQNYLHAVEVSLDLYRHKKMTFEQLLDERNRVAGMLAGRLLDHFLIRAHNSRALLPMVDDAPASPGWR